MHSNYLHQLLITPSKHFSVCQKTGKFIYHEKKLQISRKNLELPNNDLAVLFYTIRDKFSSAFYAEIFLAGFPPNTIEFLNRAWNLKADYFFCGCPKELSVPSYAKSKELSEFLRKLNIVEFQPHFADESGVIAVKLLQQELIKAHKMNFFREIQPNFLNFVKDINQRNFPIHRPTTCYERTWLENLTTT